MNVAFALAAVAALASSGAAGADARGRERGKKPVPEGARVALELDKERFLLGENIMLYFRMENAGQEPFRFYTGAGYRLARRPMGFRVTATDEAGQPVADPDPAASHRGGAPHAVDLKPGEHGYASLPLVRFCRFEKAGTYTVRAAYSGWDETPERPSPVGETKLHLAMPTEDEARRVVADMAGLPPPDWRKRGQKQGPSPDFTALQYPVYLPTLLEMARGGSEDGLEGLSAIPSPEATRALIGLLDHPDSELALKVVQRLDRRLPDPQLEGKTGPRYFLEDQRAAHRRWLVETSWRPELAPAVLAHGRKLLARNDRDSLFHGAFILECLGGKEEAPLLVQALDRAVAETQRTPRETGSYPPRRGACGELRRAAQVLIERGAEVPTDPKSPGEAVLFMMAFWYRDGFRPQGWEATCLRLLRHEIPYVRQVVLELLPRPPAAPFVELLPTLLADPDLDVRIRACVVALEAKAPELREPILKIVASAKDKNLLYVATRAADASGCRFESLELLAFRLDDPDADTSWACFDELMPRVIEKINPSTGSRFDLETGRVYKARWTKFLEDHREALQAGRRFKVGDPECTADLMPPGYRFYLRDGTTWP